MMDNRWAPEFSKRQTVKRVVDLYDDWGKPQIAAMWRVKLGEA